MRRVSNFFIFFGFLCLLLSLTLFLERNNPRRLYFSTRPNYLSNKISKNNSLPLEVKIKDINIDLPVIPSKINNETWETTTKGISWLMSSPIPGETGNSILYGHNWTNLLGNLVKIKPGQKIDITYQNKAKQSFIVTSSAVVSPNDVSILSQSNDTRITLYTCTGFLDLKRFVVVALRDLNH